MEDQPTNVNPTPAATQQPQQSEPLPPKPSNNLALAIITTVCCCLPFGIVGIVYAAKVNGLYMARQYAAAQQAADNAKKWSLIGIGIGAAIYILYAIGYAVGMGVALSQ